MLKKMPGFVSCEYLFHPLCSALSSFPCFSDTGWVSKGTQEEATGNQERREEAGILESVN